MSEVTNQTNAELNDCGCCGGLGDRTPVEVVNKPGLSAIAYRVGTHSDFKQTMLAGLSTSRQVALADLSTRASDDFSIALLDAWATVADVLTFYQERIANESYLRTATERRSIVELARAIGYELGPGVAASAFLTFKLEEPLIPPTPGITSNSPARTLIDVGTKVQSVPEPGEQAQIFETVEKIEARVAWNDIKPMLAEPQTLSSNTSTILFDGTATNIKAGDGLLFRAENKDSVFGIVEEVILQSDDKRTEVRLRPIPSRPLRGTVPDLTPPAPTLSQLAASYDGKIKAAADLEAEAQTAGFQVQELFDNFAASAPPPPHAIVLRTRAAIFGHNAPRLDALPASLTGDELIFIKDAGGVKQDVKAGPYKNRAGSWVENKLDRYHDETAGGPSLTSQIKEVAIARAINATTTFTATGGSAFVGGGVIFLDNVYSSIGKHSLAVLKDGDNFGIYQVKSVAEISKSDFTLTGKVTRLTLDSGDKFSSFGIRTTTVFAQSNSLPLARKPIPDALNNAEIKLNGFADGLFVGQTIMVSGELSEQGAGRATEFAKISKVEHVLRRDGYTKITLAKDLANSYVRATVSINGNVALATHGETKQEVLGSGDGSQAFQQFTLKQPPLTYTTAATPSGSESTLKVYVNDVLWHEVPFFFGHGPTERIYITRTGDDGKVTVQFGDGLTGSRLPGGQENVRAVYRRGIGLEGIVKANQLTLLLTRAQGVKSVSNPQAASGADDREVLADARRNAPLTVMTLDRIVSLKDYEDFARAYSGIAKALATWTQTGETRGVFVTVAGPRGAQVKEGDPTFDFLVNAMQKAGDPFVSLTVKSYARKLFQISATVKSDPDFIPDRVKANVEAALRKYFSFESREFGQPVTLSEVISVIQNVNGVIAVDADKLYLTGTTPGPRPPTFLPAAMPKPGKSAGALPAELLTLDPASIDLKVTK